MIPHHDQFSSSWFHLSASCRAIVSCKILPSVLNSVPPTLSPVGHVDGGDDDDQILTKISLIGTGHGKWMMMVLVVILLSELRRKGG